jgi:Stress responsive A/B Barrel Domain
MIRHTVVFRLKHPAGSAAEASFLKAAGELSAIHGVEKFEKLQQVSPKNDYKLGLSMEFADDKAYENYNNHPTHVKFVNERWIPEVVQFMEIDYVLIDTCVSHECVSSKF